MSTLTACAVCQSDRFGCDMDGTTAICRNPSEATRPGWLLQDVNADGSREYAHMNFANRDRHAGRNGKATPEAVKQHGAEPPRVSRANIIEATAVESRPVEWLRKHFIPLRGLTLLPGRQGQGKSVVAVDLAARVTTGRTLPHDHERYDPADVVFIIGEDDLSMTVKPRLEAANADLRRVAFMTTMKASDGDGESLFNASFDCDELADVITARKAKLVIIDPLTLFLGTTKQFDYATTYGPLAKLNRMAQQTGAAVVGIHHNTKGGSDAAIDRAMGSVAFMAAARNAWSIYADPDDESGERRILCHVKANLCKLQPSVAFTVAESYGELPIVNWGEQVHKTADELNAAICGGRDKTAVDEAVEWLRTRLATPCSANEIRQEASAEGIAPATLARAKKKLGVQSEASRNGKGRVTDWMMSLPKQADNRP